MKRLLPLLLALVLLLAACGTVPEAAPVTEPPRDPLPEETPGPTEPPSAPPEEPLPEAEAGEDPPAPETGSAEEAAPVISKTEVTLDGLSSYLRVTLPEGWTWEQAGGKTEGTVYGLYPESDPDFRVELHFWPQSFAMCGTGVTFQDYTLPNREKATLAYEMIGEELSWILILPEAPDSFTIQFAVPHTLYEAHRAELELLLSTLQHGVLAGLTVVTPELADG